MIPSQSYPIFFFPHRMNPITNRPIRAVTIRPIQVFSVVDFMLIVHSLRPFKN